MWMKFGVHTGTKMIVLGARVRRDGGSIEMPRTEREMTLERNQINGWTGSKTVRMYHALLQFEHWNQKNQAKLKFCPQQCHVTREALQPRPALTCRPTPTGTRDGIPDSEHLFIIRSSLCTACRTLWTYVLPSQFVGKIFCCRLCAMTLSQSRKGFPASRTPLSP